MALQSLLEAATAPVHNETGPANGGIYGADATCDDIGSDARASDRHELDYDITVQLTTTVNATRDGGTANDADACDDATGGATGTTMPNDWVGVAGDRDTVASAHDGDVDGVPVRYAHKRSVMDIGIRGTGTRRDHPALRHIKRSRIGEASSSHSETACVITGLPAHDVFKRRHGSSDSEEGPDRKKAKTMPSGPHVWRPIHLPRQRHKSVVRQKDQIAAQAINTPFCGGVG